MRWVSLLALLAWSDVTLASVSVITKVRCEIDFPFDSSEANAIQLDACLKKLKGSTVTPDHMAIYASASAPGKADYNFELSKRRSKAISDKLRQEFPKAEQEFFPGGVNKSYGRKAVVVASISSSESIILREKADPPTDNFLRVDRLGVAFGSHVLRDTDARYKALGAMIAIRTKTIGMPWELGGDVLSLQAEDYYDQYALSLDLGPVVGWRNLDFSPKAVVRHMLNSEGTRATDFGFRVQAVLRWDVWAFTLSGGASQESKETSGSIGRLF